MFKRFLLVILSLIATVVVGQKKYAAEQYFKEYAYKKSAELYEDIYKDGNDSYEVLSRLGDCYYYNADYVTAESWYTKLISKYEDRVEPEYVFRYSQVLKSNGKIEESDKWLLKLNQLKNSDSRAKSLAENQGYFSEYSKKKKTFVNIHNLSVNTKYSDYGGFILDNDFYFASTKPDEENEKIYKWNNQPHLNIYKAEQSFNIDEKILKVLPAEKIASLASRYHESSVAITKDGNTIYFTRTNFDGRKLVGGEDKTANLKIYKATKQNGVWTNVVEVPFNNNNYSTGHPALSADDKTLYFISDMPNGFGATDIYKVTILENGKYGEPENLGKEINTEGREMFPFVGNDNTLYFASDGHLGLGALDVFEAKINQDNSYNKPNNLGAPINGSYDDFGFVINNEKNNGFFSSNRKGGQGDDDIYSFIVYQCKEDITGVISDVKSNKPIKNAIVKLISSEGEVIAEETTGEDGMYAFYKIDCEKDFTLIASKEDYKNGKKTTQTLDVNKQAITADLQLASLIEEDQIVINPIYFDFDLFTIREDAAYELENIVAVLKNNPSMIIKIESHTDSRGPKEYNKILSDKRAKATRDYIVSRGVEQNRIESAIGYGEEQLLNNCDDENQTKCSREEHQKNRRSYFYIVKK